jgi:Zn-dependent protease with chaperone function
VKGSVQVPGEVLPRPAEITIDERRLIAIAGEDRYELPLSELVLEPGGHDADYVFCRPPDARFTILIRDPAFVAALAERADDRLRAELAKVRGHVKKHHTWRWIGIGVVAFGAIVIGGLLYSTPRILAASIDAVPASVDRELGNAAIAQVTLTGETVDDPIVRTFVEEIVDRLEPHAQGEFEFRVRVVESDEVNAFALPGGQMVVLTGLIAEASSADEIAGVLAHEMAHVTLRHGLRNVAHRAGIALAISLLLGDQSGWAELATEAAVLAQANDYSRDQESAADEEGVRMMLASGLDARGLARFFGRLEDGVPGALAWLSTHPDHRARIAHVERLVRTLPSAERRPLATDFAAVRSAVAALD